MCNFVQPLGRAAPGSGVAARSERKNAIWKAPSSLSPAARPSTSRSPLRATPGELEAVVGRCDEPGWATRSDPSVRHASAEDRVVLRSEEQLIQPSHHWLDRLLRQLRMI